MKVKLVSLPGINRLIYGKYSHDFDLDYTKSLNDLKSDIEFVLPFWLSLNQNNLINKFNFPSEETIIVYQGNHHLDIAKNGEGSLYWLRVEDHLI
ncbi:MULTISPECIES: hypothetical protein [Acinetobacter]|uniref:hypothetical protein n=1 Tax=Acinetobacter TaxID=469 RepID=UPI002898C8A2|nr:hypothetical protein [Acinetobacter variabilis]